MNELTFSNSPSFLSQVFRMTSKAKEANEIIGALTTQKNKATILLIDEQMQKQQFRAGYVIGALKANSDCLPEEIASQQKLNGIPLDLFIKRKVDNFVLDVREISNPIEKIITADYEVEYRKLSECICGFGYSMKFSERRFKDFYPKGIHMFVHGFAEGYSQTFHEFAQQACIPTDFTDPKTQDIWKNWEFFLKRDTHEYRLDGKYLFMYHGGYNCTGDDSIPYGNNCRRVNEKVYEMLKARKNSNFVERPFNFEF